MPAFNFFSNGKKLKIISYSSLYRSIILIGVTEIRVFAIFLFFSFRRIAKVHSDVKAVEPFGSVSGVAAGTCQALNLLKKKSPAGVWQM